jgi:hypothetical protein
MANAGAQVMRSAINAPLSPVVLGPGARYGINNLGEVVGEDDNGHAILSTPNNAATPQLLDLNSLIPPDQVGGVLAQATSINDRGEIVVLGTGKAAYRPVLVLEPATPLVVSSVKTTDSRQAIVDYDITSPTLITKILTSRFIDQTKAPSTPTTPTTLQWGTRRLTEHGLWRRPRLVEVWSPVLPFGEALPSQC